MVPSLGIPVVEYELRHLFDGRVNLVGGDGDGIIARAVISMVSNGLCE